MTRKRIKTPNFSKKLLTQTSELVKQVWIPLAGMIGAVLLLNQIFEIWNGNPSRTNFLVFWIVVAVWLISLFGLTFNKSSGTKKGFFFRRINFFHKPTPIYKLISGTLVLITITGITLGTAILQKRKTEISRVQDDKVIILIASFDDGDENQFDPYGIQNALIAKLKESTKDYKDVEIITLSEIVTINQGGVYARKLGEKKRADIVIWGWYRLIENPVTIYIENLSSPLISEIDPSQVYAPEGTIDELSQVEYRQKIGADISSLASFVTGLIRYQKMDFESSINAFEDALENTSNSDSLVSQTDIFFSIANSYSQMEHYQLAIDYYTKTIMLDPEYVSAYSNRAHMYVNIHQSELALADYNKAIEIDPQYPQAYSGRGALYNALQEYDLAIQDLNIGIQINPNPQYAYNNRGFSYANLHQYDKAIADYTKAIEYNPFHAVAYHNRGQVYNTLEEYDKAISDFTKAIEIYPQYDRAYHDRGISYLLLGNPSKAISDFDQAINVCPQASECAGVERSYFMRANAYLEINQQSNAISDLTKAIEIDPKDLPAYELRAKIYVMQGEYEKALIDLNTLLQIAPDYAPAYYGRGKVYTALGKHAEADVDYKKFQELTGVSIP